jgi:hypothetical protein
MSNWLTINDWLLKEVGGGQDVLASALDPSAGAGSGQPPADPQSAGLPGAGAPPPPMEDRDRTNPMEKPSDPSNLGNLPDPITPDMPDDQPKNMNFENWKGKFFKESVKGDVNELIENINKIRNTDLETYPRKFIEDNLQILFLRQNANIAKASDAIRKGIRDKIDHNNPCLTLVNNVLAGLQPMPELSNIFIKCLGLYSNKADAHRKFIAALLGAVQVGSGGQNEDIILNQKEYSIRISTRMQSKFGIIDIGKWSMNLQDPEKFLSEAEMDRLENGSPTEKDILRKRIMLESIADTFMRRSFFMNVVEKNGTVYFIGADFANALRDGYAEGRLKIKHLVSDYSTAIYDTEGNLVTIPEVSIYYNQNTGKINDQGEPVYKEYEFVTCRDGMLFLTADLDIIKEAATAFQGMTVKEIPFVGNPSEIQSLMRCNPSITELILRNCN